jgi:threonylcarbamoyladenosine tRNA methylthiotransferase MtaB
MRAELIASGHEVVGPQESPDYCIVNTCTVTSKADYQSRQLIRRASRTGARVIATGCYAELNPAEVAGMEGVERVVSNQDKSKAIAKFIDNIKCNTLSFEGRSRYTLKVQDGCNNACSYCLIPSARGRSRSVPLEEVVAEAASAIEAGFQEIVLTGVHLGQYGLDINMKLADLMEALLLQTRSARFRLSSLEVTELNDRLLDLAAEARICRHLHIPLQGGDDELLHHMRRGYDTRRFRQAIEGVVARLGPIALGTDVISGFPCEEDLMHRNTLKLLNDLPFTYIHVFPFSARPGTDAANIKDSVGTAMRRQRTAELRALSDAKKQIYRDLQLGQTLAVLIEAADGSGLSTGTSDNYLKVRVSGVDFQRGSIVMAEIVGTDGEVLVGEPLKCP